MNQQDNYETKNQSILIEDLSAQNAEALADLPVKAAQEKEIAGGPELTVKVLDGRPYASNNAPTLGTTLNHNETFSAGDEGEEAAAETESLADLPVSEEQEEEVKGGPSPSDSEWKYVSVRRY